MSAMNLHLARLTCLGLVLCQAGAAQAGAFRVKPVRLTLKPNARSQILTLHNKSKKPLRFQISAFSWRQSRTGAIQLKPTRDIIFFPALLKIAPGARRIVRVGTVARFGKTEKTYRIFVRELPPLIKSAKSAKNAVQVLTRMSIPIFLKAARSVAKARIAKLALGKGKVSLQVKNTGTAYFRMSNVRLLGRGKNGSVLFKRSLKGWYVLAGGVREYRVALPPKICAKLTSLQIKVVATGVKAQATMVVHKGNCAP
jgi:fimbrial chaperone protein